MKRIDIDIEVWQDGMCVEKVRVHDHDAMQDTSHYVVIYGQAVPVAVFPVKRCMCHRAAKISTAT